MATTVSNLNTSVSELNSSVSSIVGLPQEYEQYRAIKDNKIYSGRRLNTTVTSYPELIQLFRDYTVYGTSSSRFYTNLNMFNGDQFMWIEEDLNLKMIITLVHKTGNNMVIFNVNFIGPKIEDYLDQSTFRGNFTQHPLYIGLLDMSNKIRQKYSSYYSTYIFGQASHEYGYDHIDINLKSIYDPNAFGAQTGNYNKNNNNIFHPYKLCNCIKLPKFTADNSIYRCSLFSRDAESKLFSMFNFEPETNQISLSPPLITLKYSNPNSNYDYFFDSSGISTAQYGATYTPTATIQGYVGVYFANMFA